MRFMLYQNTLTVALSIIIMSGEPDLFMPNVGRHA